MPGPPNKEIRIWSVVDRRGDVGYESRPWVVRWKVDGRRRSRSHRTRSEADHFRSRLLQAQREGQRFDPATGEPDSWHRPGDVQVHTWARRWLAEQWPEWAPRTRISAVEELTKFIPLVVKPGAPDRPDLRRYLKKALLVDDQALDPATERWLDRWCLALNELDRSILAEVDLKLGLGESDQPLAMTTARRHRNTARACIRRAVDLGVLDIDPWPPVQKGAKNRKARRSSKAVDIRELPDPATMRRALDAIVTHQPASHRYFVMTATLYYAGLRPSEVVMIRKGRLFLPATDWGTIDVAEADIAFDEPGEPKTGRRVVPIPPVLVEILTAWLSDGAFEDDELIFRTKQGNRPSSANWRRAWRRALVSIDHRPLRLYDCRHAAATTWLSAGVPLGEVARRLGHSIDVLVAKYVGALEGDAQAANDRIERTISG